MVLRYLAGGVGLEERSRLENMAKDYNLKLVFALLSGEYLADITVEIQDSTGKHLVAASSNGPWLFAKLPAEEYRVTAAYYSRKQVREVKVGRELQTVMFHWKPWGWIGRTVETWKHNKGLQSATRL